MKVGISVIFSLTISFGILFLFLNYFPEEQTIREQQFFSKDFSDGEKLIFIFGSSHVGQLNSTLINEKISQEFPEFLVFNLSYDGDTPSERIQSIDEIIRLNPKLVFYGVSYRDFQDITSEKQPFLDPKQLFSDFLTNNLIDKKINPKLITLENIRKSFSIGKVSVKSELNHTPFYNYFPILMKITDDDELKKQKLDDIYHLQNPINVNLNTDEKQIGNFNLIIKKLQENNIDVIIFTTPLHQYAIEQIPLETKANFLKILDKIKNANEIKIYDLSHKFANNEIWSNIDHIAFNHKSKIYSGEIVKIILDEIKK